MIKTRPGIRKKLLCYSLLLQILMMVSGKGVPLPLIPAARPNDHKKMTTVTQTLRGRNEEMLSVLNIPIAPAKSASPPLFKPIQNPILPVQVFVASWDKVTPNAISIYKEISQVFDDVWFLDCDPASQSESLGVENVHRLPMDAFYGEQFKAALGIAKPNTIVGMVVGDIQTNTTDWKVVRSNLEHAFTEWDVGVFAPFESRTVWHKSNGAIMNTDMHLVFNTDYTTWFVHPETWERFRDTPFEATKFGWGIDVAMAVYTRGLGKKVVFDTSTKVINPITHGYDFYAAREGWDDYYGALWSLHIIDLIRDPAHNYLKEKAVGVHLVTDIESIDPVAPVNYVVEALSGINAFSVQEFQWDPKARFFFDQSDKFVVYKDDESGLAQNKSRKADLILAAMKNMPYGDVVVYCDGDLNVVKEDLSQLKYFIQLAEVHDLVVFESIQEEGEATHHKILKEFDCDGKCLWSNKVSDSFFFIRKCPRMERFLQAVIDTGEANGNYLLRIGETNGRDLLEAAPSSLNGGDTSPVSATQKRNDASLFSMLVKSAIPHSVIILPPIF